MGSRFARDNRTQRGFSPLTMTTFFKQLQRSNEQIRRHFITFERRPTGRYSEKEFSQFDAYALLVHAEFEAYFEACTNEAVDIAEKRLMKNSYNRIIYSLGSFYVREAQEGQSIKKVPQGDIWTEKGRWAIKQHRDVVKSNNGIKTEDICRMLIPIGVDVRTIDSVLLVELNQFGSSRGATAHSSLKARRGTIIDPFVREAEIQRLITLLKTFDVLFDKFMKRENPKRRRKKATPAE